MFDTLCKWLVPGCLLGLACSSEAPSPVARLQAFLVVEGGFVCPSVLPTGIPVGDQTVCMPEGATLDDLPADVCEQLGCGNAQLEPGVPGTSGTPPSPPPGIMAPTVIGPDGNLVAPTFIAADANTVGYLECSETTVAEFVAKIHEQRPDLADIDELFGELVPLSTTPPNYYQTAIAPEGMLVGMRRCLTGVSGTACQDDMFTFFMSTDECEPEERGTYRKTRQGTCFVVEGELPEPFGFVGPPQTTCP